MPAPRRPQRGRRKVKKNIPIGQAHIKTSFNNTIVALTDREGNVIAWESAAGAARKGIEQGMQKVEVFVKGPGSGRETAIRSLQAAGLEVTGVKDVTPQAHNGWRPRERRPGWGSSRWNATQVPSASSAAGKGRSSSSRASAASPTSAASSAAPTRPATTAAG